MISVSVILNDDHNRIDLHPEKTNPRDKQKLDLACQGARWAKVQIAENNGVTFEIGEQPPMVPIDMVLFCMKCGLQHIDGPEPESNWTNPPHRSHQCKNPECGFTWRPADIPTNGVAEIKTKGKCDGIFLHAK